MDQIKRGDIGITITVSHTASNSVYYSLNGGPEIALTDNTYLVLSAAQTAKIGVNTITFIEKADALRITSQDLYEFQVV